MMNKDSTITAFFWYITWTPVSRVELYASFEQIFSGIISWSGSVFCSFVLKCVSSSALVSLVKTETLVRTENAKKEILFKTELQLTIQTYRISSDLQRNKPTPAIIYTEHETITSWTWTSAKSYRYSQYELLKSVFIKNHL